MSTLSTAVSGLLTYQRALATTSHNIANVNTPGYSRQIDDIKTLEPELLGTGYIGRGVAVVTTQRVYDQFLIDQVASRTANYNQLEAYQTIANQLDLALGDSDGGLTVALQAFFNAVQQVASNPTSIPARQVLISEGEALTDRFQSLDSQIQNLRNNVNSQLEVTAANVNTLGELIADINLDIVNATGAAGNNPPNDLLDQRDELVRELAELTSVSTSLNSDNSINVYIGNGQALVLGSTANSFTTVRNAYDPSKLEMAFVSGGTTVIISDFMTGGKIGGLLDVREELIDKAQLDLGRIAIGVASAFNAQHIAGDDLSGTPGGLFFTAVNSNSPTVMQSANNDVLSGTLSVTIPVPINTNVNNLKASDYRLDYDGANFSLVRLSDDVTVDSGFGVGGLPRTIASEGIELSAMTGPVVAGDSFLIRPTRYAAGEMGVVITDPRTVAAAANGTAEGNNANALALAAIQNNRGLGGSTESFGEAYGGIIAHVAIKTQQVSISAKVGQGLLNQAIEARSSVSGVNLDEEAANLIKYQQAYQASAQLIAVLNEVFQTLIRVVSR